MPDSAYPSSSLHLTAGLKDLARIRSFVEESAQSCGLSPTDLPGVLLSVDEAITNIILYGYAGGSGPVEIAVSRRPDALVIQLRDEAPPFDPTAVPAPDLTIPPEEREPGGLGIYLIRQSMNELSYRQRPGGGNELTMIKDMIKEARRE